jgi:hypothetical protein
VLHHLDVIYFGSSGSMLLFKFPKMSKRGDDIANDIKEYESNIINEEL